MGQGYRRSASPPRQRRPAACADSADASRRVEDYARAGSMNDDVKTRDHSEIVRSLLVRRLRHFPDQSCAESAVA